MVISHEYRYVFVQSMKTASTAMAAELCNNYGGEHILEKHASIENFRSQANEDEETYFSFAGVRNPLDVAVSRYALRKQGRSADSQQAEQEQFITESGDDFNAYFYEFVVARYPDVFNIAVTPVGWETELFQSIDYIYKYEDLQQEFSTVLAMIGIDQKRELPLFNQTEGKGHFLNYYDMRTLRLACALFSDYMNHWGYKIPDKVKDASAIEYKVQQLSTLRKLFADTSPSFLGRTLFRRQNQLNEQVIALLDEILCSP
jgi:hypothetical protein